MQSLHAICVEVRSLIIFFITNVNTNEKVLINWRKSVKFKCSRRKQEVDIRFLHGDATAIDWSHADVVFANSTCFSDSLMRKLAKQAHKLHPGAYVITTTKPYVRTMMCLINSQVM